MDMSAWEYIDIVNGAEDVSVPCTPNTIYHCSNRDIKDLKQNDIISFKSSKGFFGEGLYFSSRIEMVYGKNVFILTKEPCVKVRMTPEYNWYLVADGEFKVIEKIDNLIYLERVH